MPQRYVSTTRADGELISLPRLATDPGDQSWRNKAACAEVGGDFWFPERGASPRQAKEICAGCRVRVECLEYALKTGEPHGVWGGKSESERHKILSERRRMNHEEAA